MPAMKENTPNTTNTTLMAPLLRFSFIILVVGVFLYPTWAQEDAATAPIQAQGTGTSNSIANDAPSMEELLKQVAETAKTLESNIEAFSQRMQDAQNSADAGKELLDEMEATVKTINGRLEENSDIWKQLNALLSEWEKKRQEALNKAETVPAFKDVAAKWSEKVKHASELRKSILQQRAESASLVDALVERRSVILAYYELGEADKVLAAMNEINESFKELNAGMSGIVEQAEKTAGKQIAQ